MSDFNKVSVSEEFTSALGSYLGVNINSKDLLTHQIEHYSYSKKSSSFDLFAIQGALFIPLFSTHLAICQEGFQDEDLSLLSSKIKDKIYSLFSKCLLESSLYPLIKFGSGVSDQEKQLDQVLFGFIDISIGMAIHAGYFEEIYNSFILKTTGLDLSLAKDNKTQLQELCQRKHSKTPTYEIVSSEGSAHELIFNATCKVGDFLTIGVGKSKKFAEGDAARKMVDKYFGGGDQKKLLLSKPDIKNFPGKNTSKFFTNERACKDFGIPVGANLNSCFIPPRMKSNGGWNGRSHRSLALLGSHVMTYLACFYAVEAISENPSQAKAINAHSARRALRTDDMVAAFREGGLWLRNFPYKHPEIDGKDQYASECIQSLFAYSFLEVQASGNIETLLKSKAADLISRKVRASPSNQSSLNSNDSSRATERLSRLGFIYEFQKTDTPKENFKVVITHLKTGKSYIKYFDIDENGAKEAKLRASRLILRVVDASEGVLPISAALEFDFTKHQELSEFLLKCMVDSRRSKSDSSTSDKISLAVKLHSSEYSKLDIQDATNAWSNRYNLSIAQQGELLSRIRLIWGVDYNLLSLRDACYIPIIFDAFYDTGVTQSIIDYDNAGVFAHESIESSLSSNDQHKDFSSSGDSSIHKAVRVSVSSSTPEISSSTGVVQVNKAVATDKLKIKPSQKHVAPNARVNELISKFSNMTLNAMETLWKQREVVLESSEEAAILLSFIRFERGIDYARQNYITFINIDLISCLDLPSIFMKTVDPGATEKSSLVTPQRNDNFEVDTSDKRHKKISEITVRHGQSAFRQMVVSNYESCCITGCQIATIVEAAHIAPYRGDKDDHIKNGLLLRVDIHRLFDANLIGINPDDLKICISSDLVGTEYGKYSGQIISDALKEPPAKSALEYKWAYFLGKQA
ncbi:putative dsRNA-binding protein [Stutzerimonas chloritidismutans]